jgi:hypothetical protein
MPQVQNRHPAHPATPIPPKNVKQGRQTIELSESDRG